MQFYFYDLSTFFSHCNTCCSLKKVTNCLCLNYDHFVNAQVHKQVDCYLVSNFCPYLQLTEKLVVIVHIQLLKVYVILRASWYTSKQN